MYWWKQINYNDYKNKASSRHPGQKPEYRGLAYIDFKALLTNS